jgi:hypothetical protein
LKYGQFRFIYVVNEDGEKLTTKIAPKQLSYMRIVGNKQNKCRY